MKIEEKYICMARGVEQFDHRGNSLGMGTDRALYYSKSIGPQRVYRSSYPTQPSIPANDFVLFEFNSKKKAFYLCNHINNANNDHFKPCFIV